ncbi:hypothetical protein LPN04_31210 [Rugamonas sp. A1-17]|nr:hypothetical protein [Rugamonas sp. A1-17]
MAQLMTGQLNATLGTGITVRTGIPHRSGKLPFHAFQKGYPTMVSAQAFWDAKKSEFIIPKATDLSETDFSLDSAGYTGMLNFSKKGKQVGIGGVFPWTYSQYLELASALNPNWYSQPDLCCEKQIAKTQEEVDYRVNATATLLEGTLRFVYAWQNEIARTETSQVAANMLKPPVPVLQGWSADDYLRSLDMMVAVWERWQPWLAAPALIGIGSVCRRDLHHPTDGLFAILKALEPHLPKGASLHLFGVKGTALDHLNALDYIESVDSMAWDLAARIKAHKIRVSNTLKHRSNEMDSWMDKAHARIDSARGESRLRSALSY